MKPVMISEQTHHAIKILAADYQCSMAELVHLAVFSYARTSDKQFVRSFFTEHAKTVPVKEQGINGGKKP